MAGVCKALFTTPNMEVGFREGVGEGGWGELGKGRKDGGRKHRELSRPGKLNLKRSKEVICLTPVEEIGQHNWQNKLPK